MDIRLRHTLKKLKLQKLRALIASEGRKPENEKKKKHRLQTELGQYIHLQTETIDFKLL